MPDYVMDVKGDAFVESFVDQGVRRPRPSRRRPRDPDGGGTPRAAVRDGDVVARIGGDEFAILSPGLADVAQVERLAARIIRLTELR